MVMMAKMLWDPGPVEGTVKASVRECPA